MAQIKTNLQYGTTGTVQTANIHADAITDAKIADDVIGTEHLTAGEVDATALGADSVTAAKIGDNVLNSEHYAAGSIDNEHLADDAVGVAELSATGTASSSTFLRGDNSWTAVTGTTINNNANNKVITGSGTANTLEGEARLLYDGDVLTQQASGSTTEFRQTVDGGGTYWSSLTASASDVKLYTRTASPLYLGTNNAEKMSINNDGSVKVGIAATPGGKFVVTSADSGATAHANADEIVCEVNGTAGISILSFNNTTGNLYFGDGQDNDIGQLSYNHTDNSMRVLTNAATALTIDNSGQINQPLQCSFLVYNNGYGQSIPNAYNTAKVTMNTEIFDVGANQDTSSALQFTAPVTGKYVMTWNV